MSAEIKFCGLTRAEDAEYAASLGASYVGVIFAGGPRMLTVDRAREVLKDVPRDIRRVGVFADQHPDDIAQVARALSLSVAQLHGGTSDARIAQIRRGFLGAIWPVARAKNGILPDDAALLLAAGDGLLLDAYAEGALGGTGKTLPWQTMAGSVNRLRAAQKKPIILAGGLRPENVAAAIAAIGPDVVDVSSGVESAPGIKDHQCMLAFRDAVAQASILT